MDVIWHAADVDARRFPTRRMRLDVGSVMTEIAELRKDGRGYFEIYFDDPNEPDAPQLSVGFDGDYAVVQIVVHPVDDPKIRILVGDGVVARDVAVRLPFMEDSMLVSGEFVLSMNRALNAVGDFVASGDPNDVGEWSDL